jgi:hypothetical protein
VMFAAVTFPEAAAALRSHVPGARVAWTGDAPGQYWRELAAAWDDPAGDLLVIEQDICPHREVIPQLETCPRPWCEFRHSLRGDPGTLTWLGLGCDRFSAALRKAVPSSAILARALADDCPAHGWAAPGELRWDHIDGPVFRALEAAGYSCHEHRPPVRHLSAETAA